jgi:hypothetical protein
MFNTSSPIGYHSGSYLASPSVRFKSPSTINRSPYYTPKELAKEIAEEIKIDEELNKLSLNEKEKEKEKEEIKEIEKEKETDDIKQYFLTKGCENLFKHFTDIKILEKTSASNSIVMFAKLNYGEIKGNDIVLKISYEEKDHLKNSLKVEDQIYDNIVSNLLNNNHTPHLIRHIASIRNCHLLYTKYKFSKKEFEYIQIKLKDFKFDYHIDEANISILERTTGSTMFDEIQTASNNEQLILIFQILYTLICFNNITLRHNDLHLSNIFVEKIPSTTYYYTINGNTIGIKTSLLSKIYDFDRSAIYSPAISRNFEVDVDYCYEFNQCQSINEKIDLQAFIGGLWLVKLFLSPTIVKWLESIVSVQYGEKLSKRLYKQISETDIITDSDLKPINICIKSLLQVMKLSNLYVDVHESEIKELKTVIYTLPPKYQFSKHFPISIATNIFTPIETKDYKDKDIDDIINRVLERTNNSDLFGVYYNEFKKLDYDIKKKSKELFHHFYKLKKMKDILRYMETCVLMSLPFWWKINNKMIKNAIGISIFGKYYPIFEANIWNLFNGKLPIEMPLV